jgi:predicted permease
MTASRERFGLRRVLVVAQVALSLVLMLGALLFSRTLYNLLSTDPGFAHREIVVANVSQLNRLAETSGVGAQLVRRELRQRLASLPEVVAIAQADVVPLGRSGFWNETVTVDDTPDRRPQLANFNRVSDGYFAVMGVPILGGRDFGDADTLHSTPVAIVSQAFVQTFLGGQSALGRRVRLRVGPDQPESVYEIVGIVGDTLVTGLRDGVEPMVYVASTQEQEPGGGTQFVIRPRQAPVRLIPAVNAAVSAFGPALNTNLDVLNVAIRDALVRERLMAALSTAFGILAGLLAAVGLYGVMSYTVSSRTNEIGIRMAMGAARRDVLQMVLREAAVLVALGLSIGGVIAVGAAGSARSLLFGLDPTDPTTVAIACGVLALIGLLAGLVPARRAASLDPSAALRTD